MPTISAHRGKQHVQVPIEGPVVHVPFPELPSPALPPPMQGRLTIRAHIDNLTGYGQLAQGIVRELSRRGIEVSVIPMAEWEGGEGWKHPLDADLRARFVKQSADDWELLIAPPLHAATPGKETVRFTMWESNRVPASAVAALNTSRAVIVPSEWCQTTFDSAGVTVPLHKCPLAVDTDLYHYKKPAEGPITFGTGGRLAHGGLRKGVREVYTAFRQAFPSNEDVRLSIKIFPDCDFAPMQDPRVTVIREAYTDTQMAAWYHSLTAYVSCATAEGFGLMPAQAMACGRAVIATQATGHAEYLDDTVGYPVRYTLRRAEEVAPGNGYYQGYWYMPDLRDVAYQMRYVYSDLKEAFFRGAFAASELASCFGWEQFGDRLTAILREVGMLA